MNNISNNFYPVSGGFFSDQDDSKETFISRTPSKSPFSPTNMMVKEGSPQESLRIADVISKVLDQSLERYYVGEAPSEFSFEKIQQFVDRLGQKRALFSRVHSIFFASFQKFSLTIAKETACALELRLVNGVNSLSPAIENTHWDDQVLFDLFSYHFKDVALKFGAEESSIVSTMNILKEDKEFRSVLLALFFAGKVTSHLLVKIREIYEGNWPENREKGLNAALLAHQFSLSFTSFILKAYEESLTEGFSPENFVLSCKKKMDQYFDDSEFYQLFSGNKVSLIVLPFQQSFSEIFSKDQELYQEMIARFS